MARPPRFVLIGHPQLMIIRGNNHAPIFITDEDYQFYLEKLKPACDKHKCQAYVLMTNHVHILITLYTLNTAVFYPARVFNAK